MKVMATLLKDSRIALLGLVLIAFSLRWGAQIAFSGASNFWSSAYSEYYNLSYSMDNGNGFCTTLNNNALGHAGIEQDILGPGCAHLPPGYPAILSAVTTMDHEYEECLQHNHTCWEVYLSIVFVQALISTGTVLCTFLLGSHFFSKSIGLLAGLFATLYPYYIWHDTSLQDTGIFTFFTTLSVLMLCKAIRSPRTIIWVLAGMAFGATVLIRTSFTPFIGISVIWLCGLNWSSTLRERLRCVLLFVVASIIVVSPWLVRNYLLFGGMVMTTQTGRFMWIGNNANTFSHYPAEPIDLSEAEAWRALVASDLETIRALSDDEIGLSRWFFKRGLDFIVSNPVETLLRMMDKVRTGFSWNFSPVKEQPVQWVYFTSYFPILLLGVTGMWITRLRWRDFGPIYLLFCNFVVGAAFFWAHTSHRSFLDVYFMVFAAYVCRAFYRKMQVYGLRRI